MLKKFCFKQAPGFLVAFSLLLPGCRHEEPNVIYMPDMVYSPAFKAQKAFMHPPVEGTVPRGFTPYPYPNDPEMAGRELKNPLKSTPSVLARGQAVFNVYCIACHGSVGEGNGTIVPRFPMPPSLQSEKIQKASDGSIFHVISRGQNLMPSYASQISTGDRWAVIHYVRALQRSKHPTPEDLKIADQESK